MSHDLYKVSRTSWAVKSHKLPEVQSFDTIERAAECMENELGINPDEVDMAIMYMAGQGHTHAHFGNGVTDRGPMFIASDNEPLVELTGNA